VQLDRHKEESIIYANICISEQRYLNEKNKFLFHSRFI